MVPGFRWLLDADGRAEKLRCVIEGASWTPSYLNEQPWNFIIATKDDSIEYERLVSCLADVNVEGARRAPVLMLSVVRLNTSSNGERNVHAFAMPDTRCQTLFFERRRWDWRHSRCPIRRGKVREHSRYRQDSRRLLESRLVIRAK